MSQTGEGGGRTEEEEQGGRAGRREQGRSLRALQLALPRRLRSRTAPPPCTPAGAPGPASSAASSAAAIPAPAPPPHRDPPRQVRGRAERGVGQVRGAAGPLAPPNPSPPGPLLPGRRWRAGAGARTRWGLRAPSTGRGRAPLFVPRRPLPRAALSHAAGRPCGDASAGLPWALVGVWAE